MKGKTAFNAMEGIDPRYILEAAPDAPVRTGSKARYIRILAVAATVAALTAVAVLGAGILKQNGDNPPVRPPVVPPVGETDEVQTPAEGEDETAAPADGSYSTDLYTVTEIDGKHYINFVDGNEKPAPESGGNDFVLKGINFQSLEEMRQKFLKGSFTAAEVKDLKSQLTLTDKGFVVPDMMNLYNAVLPEGWSVPNIVLSDDSLIIKILKDSTFDETTGDDTGEFGYVTFMSEQKYENDYQTYFVSQIEQAKEGLLKDQTNYYGIPCKMYESRNSVAKLRSVVMEFEQDGCSFEILVSYILEHDRKPELVNPDIPYDVIMYGNMDGVRFKISLYGFESVPDESFYKSFGIQDYVPTT